jgi:photosystem II stability/assembly factor-like uncharacterized protein
LAGNGEEAFVSYCRSDSEFTLRLAEDLKSAGARIWLDQLDIPPGEPWDRAVEAALFQSPVMLLILSPDSVNSDNVRDEVSFSLSKQKKVIPILYRECEVPFRLARLQHIDFRTDYTRGLKALLNALGAKNQSRGEVPVVSFPSQPDRPIAQRVHEHIEEHNQSARRAQIEKEHRDTDARSAAQEAKPKPPQKRRRFFVKPSLFSKRHGLIKITIAVLSVLIIGSVSYWGVKGFRNVGKPPAAPPVAPQSGWAVGDNGTILHTEDGGHSWKPQNSQTTESLWDVAFVTAQSGWAVSEGGVIYTDDRGLTWKPQNAGPSRLYSVDFVSQKSGWAVGSVGVFSSRGIILHTEDGGMSWSSQLYEHFTDRFRCVAFATPQSGWVMDEGGMILHTENGGVTWQTQRNENNYLLALRSIAFVNSQSSWVVGDGGAIFHTEDGGRSWVPQNSGTSSDLGSVAFATPQSGWAVGGEGVIIHTQDGGAKWSRQASGTDVYLSSVKFVTPLSGWTVGYHGTILHTEDGGTTWVTEASDTNADLRSVVFAAQK